LQTPCLTLQRIERTCDREHSGPKQDGCIDIIPNINKHLCQLIFSLFGMVQTNVTTWDSFHYTPPVNPLNEMTAPVTQEHSVLNQALQKRILGA